MSIHRVLLVTDSGGLISEDGLNSELVLKVYCDDKPEKKK